MRNKNGKYTLIRCLLNGRLMRSYYNSYEELINHISSYIDINGNNRILGKIGHKIGDYEDIVNTIKINNEYIKVPVRITKEYFVRDDKGRDILNNKFVQDVKNHKYNYKYNKSIQRKLKEIKNRDKTSELGYRKGPVMNTGKCNGFRIFRKFDYARNKKLGQNIDEDIKVNIRGKQRTNNIANPWDDIIRDTKRSWKHQGKCRKQWEHKVITKNKHRIAYVQEGSIKYEKENHSNDYDYNDDYKFSSMQEEIT